MQVWCILLVFSTINNNQPSGIQPLLFVLTAGSRGVIAPAGFLGLSCSVSYHHLYGKLSWVCQLETGRAL